MSGRREDSSQPEGTRDIETLSFEVLNKDTLPNRLAD